MEYFFSTIITLSLIYAWIRFLRYARHRKIELDVKAAYQDWWKLIEKANEELARPIDMSVLKIVNPELYSELKLRERMRKDRVNSSKSQTWYSLEQSANNLKKAFTASIIVMVVILSWCSQVNNSLCTYNDDPIMESQVKDYYSQLADQDIKDKYNARCSEKLEKDSNTRAVTISWTIRYIENTVATGTSKGF